MNFFSCAPPHDALYQFSRLPHDTDRAIGWVNHLHWLDTLDLAHPTMFPHQLVLWTNDPLSTDIYPPVYACLLH